MSTPKTLEESYRMGFENGEKSGKVEGYNKGFWNGLWLREKDNDDEELCLDKCPDWVSLPFSPKENPEVCAHCKEAGDSLFLIRVNEAIFSR